MEEPASDCNGCKADDDDYEHYNPAPVSRHPREGIKLAGERANCAGMCLTKALVWDS